MLWVTAVVGEPLELEEVVADILELKDVVAVRLVEGELVIA